MKQRIVPVALIVALIAFFVIIDRKEFSRLNNIQPIQRENVSDRTETIPAVSAKPAIETRPFVDTKPPEVTDKQEEGLKTQTQTETTPVSESGIKEAIVSSRPFAVPVLSQEEAEKANLEAFAYAAAEKEKTEPFFQMYEGSQFDTISFEGTVKAVSTIPDPEQNDYPNCLYALFVDVNSVSTNNPPSNEMAQEIIINVPIMKDQKIVDTYKFLPGDKISCHCAEYESMPQSIQEIQLSDDIQAYEYQQYYLFSAKRIEFLQIKQNKDFAKQQITIPTIQANPKDEIAARLRNERIQKEIARIEDELKRHGGSFETWKKEYEPIAEKYSELVEEGWNGWINNSFFAAGGKEGEETKYYTKKYIEGLKPYKEYLESKNIDLIIVRMPGKGDFAARVLAADDFQENPAWVEHYYECLKNDIEIVDPMPEMWKHRFDYTLFYYFKPEEFHPFEGTYYCCASVLSDVLKRYDVPGDNHSYSLKRVSHIQNSSLFKYPAGNPNFDSQKNMEYNQVLRDDCVIDTFSVNSGSPILFLSNSFFGAQGLAKDLGLPQYSSYFLKMIPDWIYQSGSTSLIRNLLTSKNDSLSGRKAVIMVGMPRMWISFPSFPRYVSDNAKNLSLEYKVSVASENVNILNKTSYQVQKEDNGNVSISPTERGNDTNPLTIATAIPAIDGKRVCMIRIKIINGNGLYLAVNDAMDNSLIDSCSFPGNDMKYCDLFVPVESKSRPVTIMIRGVENTKEFEDIELWYY